MLFGFPILDRTYPIINSVLIYHQNGRKELIPTKKIRENQYELVYQPNISGPFNIGINTYDLLDAAPNKNGVYSIELYNNDVIFPVISNQKINKYLKQIASICGIDKNITFHSARHTFATTITLCNGMPIETVSKMLGHNNIKTTQIYARVIDSKVSSDMQVLRKKFM